jgi:hypothetical protein
VGIVDPFNADMQISAGSQLHRTGCYGLELSALINIVWFITAKEY